MDRRDPQPDPQAKSSSNAAAEPAIDALPLDLFGAPAAAPPSAAPPVAEAAPGPAPTAAPAPAAQLPLPPFAPFTARLRRLYDALGVLLLFVVIGVVFGAFTWRVLWLLPLCAVLYFWPLRRFRARWHARLDDARVALERE